MKFLLNLGTSLLLALTLVACSKGTTNNQVPIPNNAGINGGADPFSTQLTGVQAELEKFKLANAKLNSKNEVLEKSMNGYKDQYMSLKATTASEAAAVKKLTADLNTKKGELATSEENRKTLAAALKAAQEGAGTGGTGEISAQDLQDLRDQLAEYEGSEGFVTKMKAALDDCADTGDCVQVVEDLKSELDSANIEVANHEAELKKVKADSVVAEPFTTPDMLIKSGKTSTPAVLIMVENPLKLSIRVEFFFLTYADGSAVPQAMQDGIKKQLADKNLVSAFIPKMFQTARLDIYENNALLKSITLQDLNK